jgi:HEAT repeat protein
MLPSAMRRRIFALSFAGLALAAGTASATVDAVAPGGLGVSPKVPGGASSGSIAVRVDLPGKRVVYQSCPAGAPCAVGPASPSVVIGADPTTFPSPANVSVDVVPVAGGRSVVHVRIPLAGPDEPLAPAWEGLFASGAPPLFAAVTGWTQGQPGERSGTALRRVDVGSGKMMVQGDIREELRICGEDATLLRPQGLNASLAWQGASWQRLSAERREKAIPIAASLRGGAPPDPPLAQLLAAQGASTAIGAPKALSDGDPETTWSEARPGQGQGEFVLFQAPHEVPLTRFALVVAPRAPKPEGAAPKTFYLATDAALFEVTMPEDAWLHPGAAYDIALPDPVATSCVALVLGDAFTRDNPKPVVTLAELYAYSAFDSPGSAPTKLESVVLALAGGGPRAEAAAGVLKRAGDAGLDAAASSFAKLDAPGRALAVDVAASAPRCESSARLLVPALADPDEVVREKARAKLEQPHCGHAAVPALVAALSVPETRVRAATLLSSVSPSQALAPLAKALGQGSVRERAQLRSAFAHAATQATPAELAALLAEARDPEARVELLRAAESRLGEVQSAADQALDELLSGPASVKTRYVLASPIAALARAGNAKDDARLLAWLGHDDEPVVRVHAAELAGASAKTQAGLDAASRDPEPRVREAALRTVGTSRVRGAEAGAILALERDPWTFVRAEAAGALAALPASQASDEALARALGDRVPRVRAAAIGALAGHTAVAYAGLIRARLDDAKEDVDVRVAAAHAAGTLCDARALDSLSRDAVSGASSPDPNEVALGLAATDALAAIHPADLANRLKAIHGKGARPDAQRAADAALAARGTCQGVSSP